MTMNRRRRHSEDDPATKVGAALYIRVSTDEQAQHELSQTDQINQATAFAKNHDWVVRGIYVDGGFSGRSDKRPQFQKLVEDAKRPDCKFKNVIIHSWSRFGRNLGDHINYKKELKKLGKKVYSITQDFGDGPAAEFATNVIAMMDEWQSERTSEDVTRTMKENARQGYHNGSKPPFGYDAVVVEMKGMKAKKKLFPNEREQAVVRKMFDLAEQGDAQHTNMGITHIMKWINHHGMPNRGGTKFYKSHVGKILTNEAYIGQFHWNKRDPEGNVRPRKDWITVEIPPIIEAKQFWKVQKLMKQRDPQITAPRLTNNEVLLSGIAFCGSCGAPMARCSGSGRRRDGSKKPEFRYYKCRDRLHRAGCGNDYASMRVEQLDELVINALCVKLLTAERVRTIVSEIVKLRQSTKHRANTDYDALKRQLSQKERELKNLMDGYAEGLFSDSPMLRKKVKSLEVESDNINGLMTAAARTVESTLKPLTLDQARCAAAVLAAKLREADPAPRKRLVHALCNAVIVFPDRIKIIARKPELAEVASGISPCATFSFTPVHSFDRSWWARQDSNLRPDRYERPALTS
jgi:site-specific DNA recombinase